MNKDEEEISYATNKKNLLKSKIVFVGDQYVGKTSIITRFIKDTFDSDRNPTIGIDFVSKNVTLGTKMMRLQLWDTAGQQRFRSLIPNYIRDCQVALIIFDLTNEESYQNISNWTDFVKQHRGQDVMIVVVGNKIDSKEDRKINYDTAHEKFKGLDVKYYEVSAKTGENIQKMFQQICAALLHIESQNNLPPIEIMQSKLVSNVSMQREGLKIKNGKREINSGIKSQPSGNKLTKSTLENSRRVKQKGCC